MASANPQHIGKNIYVHVVWLSRNSKFSSQRSKVWKNWSTKKN